MIAPERVEQFLHRLPVDALWGVGPVTANRLRERGIERLVDVRTVNPAVLREAVGSHRRLAAAVRGRHRRSTGRTEPIREVVGHREHVRGRSHRSR